MSHVILFWMMYMLRFASSIETGFLLDCFTYVAEKYFHEKMVLLMTWNQGAESASDWMKEIIRYMVSSNHWSVHLSNENYTEPDVDYFYLRVEQQRAWNIVIMLREEFPDAKEKLLELTENRLWDSRGRILIVMESSGNGESVLRHIWRSKKALNVVVMAADEKSIRFVAHDPFSFGNETVLVNVWNGSFQSERKMFQLGLPKNLNKFLLRIGVMYAEPYVLRPKNAGIYVDGVEIRIAKALSHNLNFRIQYVEPPKGQDPFIAAVNGTPSGLFGLLHRGVADVVYSGMRNRFDRNIFSDPLTMHTEDRSVWIVPILGYRSRWDSFYRVFTIPVWIVVTSCATLLPFVFYLLSHSHRDLNVDVFDLSDCFLETLGNQLNFPTCIKVTRFRLKMFITVIYLYALHITSAYQSTLVQLWTTPTDTLVFETPDEAVDAGLIAYLYKSDKPDFNQTNHDLWNKIMRPYHHMYSNDYSTNLAIVSQGKSAFTLMLENVAKYEVSKSKIRNRRMIHIIEKEFATYPINFFMSRGHPMRDLIDRKVQQLVEGGIVCFWLNDFLYKYRKISKREARAVKAEALTLKHFESISWMVGGCWAICVLVFFLELWKGRRGLRLWKRARKLVLGDRLRR